MHRQTIHLDDLPGAIVDLDVTADGRWVAVCRRGRDEPCVVVTEWSRFEALGGAHLVRWLDANRLLVVDEPELSVITVTGERERRWSVGPGVYDVLVARDRIVTTYHDEGCFSGHELSEQGLCVFSADGTFRFGYRAGVLGSVPVLDCYCACITSHTELCFSPYNAFPLVRLDLETRTQTVHDLPRALQGASALSSDGVDFYVYSHPTLYRWRPGRDPVAFGDHSGPLRGLRRGAFLSVGESGYTIIREAAR